MHGDELRSRYTGAPPSATQNAHPVVGFFVALLLCALTGCGNDVNPASSGANEGSELAGSWQATSFLADGNDVIGMGMSVAFTFTVSGSSTLRGVAGTFAVTITNDIMDICDGASSCTPTGTFEVANGLIVFDPGTQDELVWEYSVTGQTLFMSATTEGTILQITATRS